jgi:hypothetical protein
VAVSRGIGRSGSIATAATSKAAAAAIITEAATGDIFKFMGFLDSWVCEYRFSTLRRFDSSGQISKTPSIFFQRKKSIPCRPQPAGD